MCGMGETVARVDERDRTVGLVDRWRAVREGWLHRVAVTVCRDEHGRVLVHRRAERLARYPGWYEVVVGGAVRAGESYARAAGRELTEELGVLVPVRPLFRFLNRSGLSPHWLGVHEALVPDAVVPDAQEVAWYGWLTVPELWSVLREWPFTPDGHEVLGRAAVPGEGCGGLIGYRSPGGSARCGTCSGGTRRRSR